MQNISLPRLYATMRWYLSLHARRLLLSAAGVCLFVLVSKLPVLRVPHDDFGSADTLFHTFLSLLGIYMVTCGALIASDVPDPRRRMQLFLLPASRLEKFLCRYADLLLAEPFALVAGLIAGDVLQMLLCAVVGVPVVSLTLSSMVSTLPAIPLFADWKTAAMVTSVIFLNSFFLLAGTLFRRHAWIKSCLLLFVTFLSATIAVWMIVKLVLDAVYGEGNYSLVMINSNWTGAALSAVCILLAVFNYWAAFRVYSRMQAVNATWHNF